MREHRQAAVRPLVDRVATHIHDPVARLRYLRAAAGVASNAGQPQWRYIGRIFVIAIAPIALACAWLVLVPAISSRLGAALPAPTAPAPPLKPVPTQIDDGRAATDVWLVEKSADSETYSNGLRIDNRFLVTTRPRSFLAFPADGGRPVRRSEPVGIVFHTTESPQAPFEEDENRVLKRIGESLLEYVRRIHAYNFVIDRFGRVYRVVAEDQVANHAGHSVWADENWFYVNLNESFLGISFEAASPTAQSNTEATPAQVRSAAMLVEMLRLRFRIPASNYVTHAQVSVNPSNMRVGLHVDWASGFPFAAVGLADNDAAPLPSLWAFGFDCDEHFTRGVGAAMRDGIGEAEAMLAQKAAAAGLRPEEYKERLRKRYREMLAQVSARDVE